MRLPTEVGRIYKPVDWYGWAMSILGLVLMAYFGGLIDRSFHNWWLLAVVFFCFWEYAIRVAFGRVYKLVYHDTVIHNMYELKVGDEKYYVCAMNENELDCYMELKYPELEYEIVEETHVESFIKTDRYC